MRTLPRIYLLGLLVLCLGGAIGWSLFRPQAAPAHSLDQIVPEGSLLYIEAKDFSSLLKDWTSSAWAKPQTSLPRRPACLRT
jgi:hypothetical protein